MRGCKRSSLEDKNFFLAGDETPQKPLTASTLVAWVATPTEYLQGLR